MNEIKQCLDFILKWISLRFFDTNTSVLLNSLDFLSKCVKALVADDYKLMEQEAAAFMPYLVTKVLQFSQKQLPENTDRALYDN